MLNNDISTPKSCMTFRVRALLSEAIHGDRLSVLTWNRAAAAESIG